MKDVLKDMNFGVVKSMMMELEKAVRVWSSLTCCSFRLPPFFPESTNGTLFPFLYMIHVQSSQSLVNVQWYHIVDPAMCSHMSSIMLSVRGAVGETLHTYPEMWRSCGWLWFHPGRCPSSGWPWSAFTTENSHTRATCGAMVRKTTVAVIRPSR